MSKVKNHCHECKDGQTYTWKGRNNTEVPKACPRCKARMDMPKTKREVFIEPAQNTPPSLVVEGSPTESNTPKESDNNTEVVKEETK